MAYCTNCGNEVHERAVACPKCGVPPQLEKNHCNNCGEKLQNPNQVLCTKCGVSIGKTEQTTPAPAVQSASQGSGQSLNRQTFILFAIFFGWLGIHNFYAGRKMFAIPLGFLNILLTIALPVCIFFISVCEDNASTFRQSSLDASRNAWREGYSSDDVSDRLRRAADLRWADEARDLANTYHYRKVACLCLAFVLATGHIIWIIRDIAVCRTDGNGIPMT